MSFINFLFAQFKAEDPLRKVANARQQNRIANILNDISGDGCAIEKPTNAEGRGWRVVVPNHYQAVVEYIEDIIEDYVTGETEPPLNTQYVSVMKSFYRLSDSASYDVVLDDTIDYRARNVLCWITLVDTGTDSANPTIGEKTIMATLAAGVIVAATTPYSVYISSVDGSLNLSATAIADPATEWAYVSIQAWPPFAATACPCPVWPGTSTEGWPCGGLVQEYDITDTLVSPEDGEIILGRYEDYMLVDCAGAVGDWHEFRFKTASVTVTATATACTWYLADVIEYRNGQGQTTWLDIGEGVTLELENAIWIIKMDGASSIQSTPSKPTGLTPVGELVQDSCLVCPSICETYRLTGSATVAEAT